MKKTYEKTVYIQLHFSKGAEKIKKKALCNCSLASVESFKTNRNSVASVLGIHDGERKSTQIWPLPLCAPIEQKLIQTFCAHRHTRHMKLHMWAKFQVASSLGYLKN